MRMLGTAALTLLLVCAGTSTALAGISDGPYLQNVSTDGITVCFTSTGADATVNYGPDAGYGESEYSTAPIVIGAGSDPLYQIRLTGLSPESVYHYQVISGGDTSPDYAFTTAANPGTPFRFCAYGDNRRGVVVQMAGAVIQAMLPEAPEFVINTGDIVNFDEVGGDPVNGEWVYFFENATELISQAAFFGIRGNHDDSTNLFELFMDNPTAASGNELYYSFDYGNAHFLALDSTLTVCSGAQYDFVEADLAAHAGSGPLFAFFHHPPFSNGSHGGDTETHNCWAPLFQEYGVDIVFGGHDHLYTRYGLYPTGSPVPGINGVNYIVTGGGGAPPYVPRYGDHTDIMVLTKMKHHFMTLDINGDDISVVVKDETRTVIDSFTLDASANDGLYDRTDTLPPADPGGGVCGTVPSYSTDRAATGFAAMGLYLIPAAFLLLLRRRVRIRA